MTTRDKLTFVHSMARSTRATVRQCEALLRYSTAIKNIETWASIEPWNAEEYRVKRDRIQRKVTELCGELSVGCDGKWEELGRVCVPVFAGPALKIRTPGGEEITCPS